MSESWAHATFNLDLGFSSSAEQAREAIAPILEQSQTRQEEEPR
jgi:hypothetical protein